MNLLYRHGARTWLFYGDMRRYPDAVLIRSQPLIVARRSLCSTKQQEYGIRSSRFSEGGKYALIVRKAKDTSCHTTGSSTAVSYSALCGA